MPLNWGICRLGRTTGERKQATISGQFVQSSRPFLRALIGEWLFAMTATWHGVGYRLTT
jgi:hypothetical protein